MQTFTSTMRPLLVVTFMVGLAHGLFVPSTADAQVYTTYDYASQQAISSNIQNLLPKCTLGANPVTSTTTTTLSWGTENASYVTITDIGSVALTGQYTLSVYGTRTFVLTATNAYGTRNCSVTVFGDSYSGTGYNGSVVPEYNPSTGTTGTPENPGCYIKVTPEVVANNTNNVTLTWVGAGALSATISGMGTVATSGNQAITPRGNQTYTLTVFGLNNMRRTCSTTVQMANTAGLYYGGQYGNQSQYPYNYSYQSGYTNYNNYTHAYNDIGYQNYGGQRVNSVRLSRVPYTGPIDDMVAGFFSLAVLVSSAYGTRRILG